MAAICHVADVELEATMCSDWPILVNSGSAAVAVTLHSEFKQP